MTTDPLKADVVSLERLKDILYIGAQGLREIDDYELEQFAVHNKRTLDHMLLVIALSNHQRAQLEGDPTGFVKILKDSTSVYDGIHALSDKAFGYTCGLPLQIHPAVGDEALRTLTAQCDRVQGSDGRGIAHRIKTRWKKSPSLTCVECQNGDVRDTAPWYAELGEYGRVGIYRHRTENDREGEKISYVAVCRYVPTDLVHELRAVVRKNPERFKKIPMTEFKNLPEVAMIKSLTSRNARHLLDIFLGKASKKTAHDSPAFSYKRDGDGKAHPSSKRTLVDVTAQGAFENWEGIPDVVNVANTRSDLRAMLPPNTKTVVNMFNNSLNPFESTRKIMFPVNARMGYVEIAKLGNIDPRQLFTNAFFHNFPVGTGREFTAIEVERSASQKNYPLQIDRTIAPILKDKCIIAENDSEDDVTKKQRESLSSIRDYRRFDAMYPDFHGYMDATLPFYNDEKTLMDVYDMTERTGWTLCEYKPVFFVQTAITDNERDAILIGSGGEPFKLA